MAALAGAAASFLKKRYSGTRGPKAMPISKRKTTKKLMGFLGYKCEKQLKNKFKTRIHLAVIPVIRAVFYRPPGWLS